MAVSHGHIPTMKRLYAEYHDKGVEFIGVSLDHPEEHGGLEALKAFVAKEQIRWPQYYEDSNRIAAGPDRGRLIAFSHRCSITRASTRTAA